jgi:hypothetical protein
MHPRPLNSPWLSLLSYHPTQLRYLAEQLHPLEEKGPPRLAQRHDRRCRKENPIPFWRVDTLSSHFRR